MFEHLFVTGMEYVMRFYTLYFFKVVTIVFVAWVVYKVSDVFIEKSIRRFIVRGEGMTAKDERKREDTLIRIVSTASGVLIWMVAIMFLVNAFGIAIAPIVTAAGILGVAVGFGAQYLVRDLITGVFMILENQYRLGDVVCFDTTCGAVTDITLRKTTLRDLDGIVHHIPHGSIVRVSNKTQEFSRIKIDLHIAYTTDIDYARKVIDETGRLLAEDPEWKDRITRAPHFLRVNAFGDSAMVVRVLGETGPGDQWAVAGEFRRRIKMAFDAAGIEIPLPQRVVHMKEV